MSAIITTAMRVASAKNFQNYCQITLQNTPYVAPTTSYSLYTFISRTLPWAIDASPPTPIDCVHETSETLREMIAAKRVGANNISLVAPRYNWTQGTTYTQYSDSINLFDPTIPPFYVVTSNLNVYKCLNNSGNSLSTISPDSIGPTTNYATTADGYQWKFMFTINSADATNFITTDWIPVKTLSANDGSVQWTVQQAAVIGEINSINVSLGGSGYNSPPAVVITGDGTGASATAIINSGSVTSVVITNRGSGPGQKPYSYANVTFSGGGGSGATATAVVSPTLGQGADPVSELGAYTTMIAVALTTTESGDFTVSNDFRRIGLIQNPLQSDGITPAFALDYDLATVTILSNATGTFVGDEQVTGSTSGTTGYVLDWTSSTGVLRVVQCIGTFVPTETVVGSVSGASGTLQTLSATTVSATPTSMSLPNPASTVDSAYNGQTVTITGGTGVGQTRTILTYTGNSQTLTVSTPFTTAPDSTSTFVISNITPPGLSLTSGTILYLENRTPIMRASDQTEQIRFLIAQ